MSKSYLKCFTLGRAAPLKDRRDYLLACNREQVLSLLALHLETKQIMAGGQRLVRARIPHSAFSISRPSSKFIASYLLRCGYLTFSRNPLIRQMETWLYEYQLIRHFRKREETLDEVVIEIFYSERAFHSPPASLEESTGGLTLARLHFWEQTDGQTYLRVFMGWDDDVPLAMLQMLYGMLQGYDQLLEQAAGREFVQSGGTSLYTGSLTPEIVLETDSKGVQLKAWPSTQTDGIAAEEDNSVGENCYQAAEVKSDEFLHEAAEGYFPDTTEEVLLEPSDTPSDKRDNTAGVSIEGSSKSLADKQSPLSKAETSTTTLPADEELYRLMKPPRIYGKTLAKVCLMVAQRQQQIYKNGRIQDINQVRDQCGPSKNTLLKLPELVTNWYDRSYHWNVMTWLTVYSGHTEKEISERLSYLKANLTEEVWAVVAQTDEKAVVVEGSRHHGRNGRNARVKANAAC